MSKKRCPWCGRKKTFSGIVEKKATPRLLTFTKCGYCNNYYGQNIYTKKGAICAGILLLACIMPILFENGLFSLLIPGPAIYLFTLPKVRMTKDEYVVEDDSEILTARITSDIGTVKRNSLYFFSNTFDSNPVLKNASPIKVRECNNEGIIKFSFLYESENNRAYMNNSPVRIYDTNMEYVGEIVINNQ